VALDTVATLDFAETQTYPSPGGLLAQGGRQARWFFVDPNVSYEILVFRSSGEYETKLGGQGEGPGEYRAGPLGINALVFDSSDTLWVFSQRGRRADLYAPELTWARGMTLEGAVRAAAPLGGGRLVAVTAGVGAQLAYVDREGRFQPLASPQFASSEAALVPLASDGVRRFWVAEPHSYQIWEVRVAEAPRQVTRATPAWFDETFSAAVREEFGQVLDNRGATILSLRFDRARDVLWLTAGIPSRTLEVETLRRAVETRVEGTAIARLVVDHVVEGVRTSNGAPLGAARFDFLGVTTPSPEQYEVTDRTRISVVRPTLR
jgi:hypothetical protein